MLLCLFSLFQHIFIDILYDSHFFNLCCRLSHDLLNHLTFILELFFQRSALWCKSFFHSKLFGFLYGQSLERFFSLNIFHVAFLHIEFPFWLWNRCQSAHLDWIQSLLHHFSMFVKNSTNKVDLFFF